ncbi:hypothetical protein Bbelb_349600 [Branchiostoma belcheri]|nr:hypothetical protein Bbelb_349600 [Branchiostoma belcheri]
MSEQQKEHDCNLVPSPEPVARKGWHLLRSPTTGWASPENFDKHIGPYDIKFRHTAGTSASSAVSLHLPAHILYMTHGQAVIIPATNRLNMMPTQERHLKHMKTMRPEHMKAIRPMHMKAIRPKHMETIRRKHIETKMVLQKSASPMRKWLSTRHMLMLSLDISVTCMEEQN